MASVDRVFIVDGDPNALTLFESCLSAAGFDVATFDSAETLLEHGPIHGPACLVIDISLPGTSGLELQKALADDASVSIVFVTAQGDVPTVVDAMKRGAVDFLIKPVKLDELVDAVVRGLERSVRADSNRRLRETFDERLTRLTPREHQVVTRVVRGSRNKQIASELGTTEKTVKVHRARAMEKLAVGSVAELVRIVEQTGHLA
jgi:FixJ family two-component response regulator